MIVSRLKKLSTAVLLLPFLSAGSSASAAVYSPVNLGLTQVIAQGDDAFADAPKETKSKETKKGYAEEAVKHYNKGVEFHQQGNLNQAIQSYKAAIDADGRLAEAYSNLGAVYLAQRSYQKAAEAFNKALALKPDRPTTLNGLGNALYARGQAAEAKDRWAKAIEIDPNFASAYYNMGNALETEKDDKSAITQYMKAIDANPKMADAFFRIGGILHKTKHIAQSNVFLKKSIELSPTADFQREANKMLKEQELEFSRETVNSRDSETTMTSTKESTSATKKNSGPSGTVAAVEKKAATDKEKSSKTGDLADKEKKRLPFFGRKPKEEKKIDMFVQPQAGSAEDLKPTPQATPQGEPDAWK